MAMNYVIQNIQDIGVLMSTCGHDGSFTLEHCSSCQLAHLLCVL